MEMDPEPLRAIGVAQAIFYVPVFGVACHLGFKKHGPPRLAWIALGITSIFRFVAGIYLYSSSKSIPLGIVGAGDWYSTNLALQSIGIAPLLLTTFGLFKIIQHVDIPTYRKLRIGTIAVEVILLLAFVGLIFGNTYQEDNIPLLSDSIGLNSLYFGYSLTCLIFVVVIYFTSKMWKINTRLLSPERSEKALIAITWSIPFIFARILYAFLSTVESYVDPLWSPLWGDRRIYICLHCLTEFFPAIIYMVAGFRMQPIGKLSKKDVDKESLQDSSTEEPK